MTVRIATVQAEATPGDIAVNVARTARWIDLAAEQSVDVIVFPEAFPTGYDESVFAGPLPTAGSTDWLAPVQGAVDRTGIVAVVNTALDRGDRRTLTDVIVAPGRAALPAYDKEHLYDSERTIFAAGDAGSSFVVRDLRLALSVCYDANFPEHAAAAAAAGADVYVNSGAYLPGGAARRDLHYAARALDNGIYVVFSGLVGSPHEFIGGSAVFDPSGRRIASVEGREGLAIADLHREEITRVREGQRMWADRRPDLGPHRSLDRATSHAPTRTPAH